MTDDEAFIRRIVDSPGDDAPRLVYADWLDDRGDPRGAYLRAEREAYHSGDVTRMRELAAGLDPVWAARVSLPPYGACVEHLDVTRRGRPLALDALADIEHEIDASLPADYKAFLLNYNGGWVPTPLNVYEIPGGEFIDPHDHGWTFEPAISLRFTQTTPDCFSGWPLSPDVVRAIDDWLFRHLYIGSNPDFIYGIFLGVRPPTVGHVQIVDTSVEYEFSIPYAANQRPLAASFSELLDLIPERIYDRNRLDTASPTSVQ